MAIVSCRATSVVPNTSQPELRIIPYEEIQGWILQLDEGSVFRDKLATYLWTYKDALSAAAQDCPTTAAMVKNKKSSIRVEDDRIWEHMEKAYEASNQSVTSEPFSSPRLVFDDMNNVYVLCPSAQPGDVIFQSDDLGHALQYVLRQTSARWTVIGTAIPIDFASLDADGEHVDIFLDPLNAFIFSNPLRDVVPKFDDAGSGNPSMRHHQLKFHQ
ncbi:hypothetical protein HII31_01240 [Pseudocercospora fuligena]|uniref:Uncharacterized protein n=1 Tax=Pseudocercospora fuligena TaxID=685502 RepID=A0A8H6RT31_9PEZI|nr:hypothetical protein HII31_01240 [Pseudocercospora fuligena]